jgi:hypothetical protein
MDEEDNMQNSQDIGSFDSIEGSVQGLSSQGNQDDHDNHDGHGNQQQSSYLGLVDTNIQESNNGFSDIYDAFTSNTQSNNNDSSNNNNSNNSEGNTFSFSNAGEQENFKFDFIS